MIAGAVICIVLGAIFGLGMLLGAMAREGGAAREPERPTIIPRVDLSV